MWKKSGPSSASSVSAPTAPTATSSYNGLGLAGVGGTHQQQNQQMLHQMPSTAFYSASSSPTPPTASWSLLSVSLEVMLWYFNFVHPIYIGSQLCKKVNPNPRDIANCVVAFTLLWFLELGDQLILKDFIAMRNVYVFGRILFCMYLLHPKFHGALVLYEKCGIRNLVEAHGRTVDLAVTNNIVFLRNQGVVEYGQKAVRYVFAIVREVLYIVRQLMLPVPSSDENGDGTADRGSHQDSSLPRRDSLLRRAASAAAAAGPVPSISALMFGHTADGPSTPQKQSTKTSSASPTPTNVEKEKREKKEKRDKSDKKEKKDKHSGGSSSRKHAVDYDDNRERGASREAGLVSSTGTTPAATPRVAAAFNSLLAAINHDALAEATVAFDTTVAPSPRSQLVTPSSSSHSQQRMANAAVTATGLSEDMFMHPRHSMNPYADEDDGDSRRTEKKKEKKKKQQQPSMDYDIVEEDLL